MPRARPRILSNIQLVPPREGAIPIGGGAKSLESRDLGKDSNKEGSMGGSEDNRSWRNVTAKRETRKGYIELILTPKHCNIGIRTKQRISE